MKLPDFTYDANLLALRRLMGADAPGSFSPSYRPDALSNAELEQLATEGKDVSIEEIAVLADGTLSYKASRVLVYIRDIEADGRQWAPKFHVAHCRTLQHMLQQNRFQRYVVATRDDGLFRVNRTGRNREVSSALIRLDVCQNCLDNLGFEGFSRYLEQDRRLVIVSRFTIRRFFDRYPRSLLRTLPTGGAATAPINHYTTDFDALSTRVRAQRGWRCERCRRDLSRSTDRKYLHVHHKNGMKNENHDANLQVLCLGCHAEEPLHARLKNLEEYREFVNRFGV